MNRNVVRMLTSLILVFVFGFAGGSTPAGENPADSTGGDRGASAAG